MDSTRPYVDYVDLLQRVRALESEVAELRGLVAMIVVRPARVPLIPPGLMPSDSVKIYDHGGLCACSMCCPPTLCVKP